MSHDTPIKFIHFDYNKKGKHLPVEPRVPYVLVSQ